MKRFRWIRRPAFRLSFYAVIIGLLVLFGIYQVFDLYTNLRSKNSTQSESDTTADEDSSLLEPYSLYWTLDGERYGMLCELSGYYSDCWDATEALLLNMAKNGLSFTEIEASALPEEAAGMVLMYEAELEETALSEYLGIDIEDIHVSQIFILPAVSTGEDSVLYLMDWEAQIFYQAEAEADESVLNAFQEVYNGLQDVMSADYIDAHQAFPALFDRTVFVQESSVSSLYYIPEISVSFLEDGGLDLEAAQEYALHFFTHPDVVSSLAEEDEDFIWYADEKRTVRYDQSGLLQYVATLEPSEETVTLSVSDAYELASGFLKEDLAEDENLLQEVYLESYTVDGDGIYTFVWNYAYRHVPFLMSETSAEATGLEGPIVIVVEGSQIRYYQRYLLSVDMSAEETAVVVDSFIDAADRLAEERGLSEIQSVSLIYTETDHILELNWEILASGESFLLDVGEARV